MNTTRQIVNLKKVNELTPEQKTVFAAMYGAKGRNFSADSLLKKVSADFVPADTKEADLEKAQTKAKKSILDAFKALEKAGLVSATVKEEKVVEGEYVMQAYHIEDLPEEMQLGIGEKVHTSLTANSSQVFYKGDKVMYKPHALSPEGKAGQVVATGTVKSFHVNEEGFLYLILEKPAETDKDGKTKKRKTCAVKASKGQLVDDAIPPTATECVTYKKKAGLKKPELADLSAIETGEKILHFTNIWSPTGKHMNQIVDGLVQAKKNKVDVLSVNTDHQIAPCIKYNIRTAPTLIRIKNGKEVSRIEGIPAENPNETILKFIK